MKTIRRMVVLVCAVILLGPGPAGASDVPLDGILGADPGTLDAKQLELAKTIMQTEKVYYGCKGTIAVCLAGKNESMTARRLAGMVVRKVKAGYDADKIHEMIEKRGLSMHPIKTHQVTLEGAPSTGAASPSVKVVAFSDFQCPYCRKVLPRLEKLSGKLSGVKLYFKHFPVKSHKLSVPAAQASMAAFAQGKFWPFHDLCYKDPDHLDKDDLFAKAKEAGVADMAKFEKDFGKKEFLKIIETDKVEGLKLGVKGTPTVFIDGKLYTGETTYEDLKDVLSEELDLVAGKK